MKKNLSKSLSGMTLLLALALTGCGSDDATPGNLAAYQQGSNKCSEEFVRDYLELYSTFTAVSPTSSSDLDGAQGALNQFGAKYKDVACKLEYQDQSEMVNVNDVTSRLDNIIGQARRSLSSESSTLTYSAPAPAPNPVYGNSVRFEQGSEVVKNGIILQVGDPSVFSPANWQYPGMTSIQNGHVINEFGANEDIDGCEIRYHHQGPDLHAGSKIHLEIDATNPLLVQFHPADASFTLTCHHDGVFNLSSFTLEDLNRVLGSLATASITQ
jgi:hypothetical protein